MTAIPEPNTIKKEIISTIVVLIINLGMLLLVVSLTFLFEYFSTIDYFYWIIASYVAVSIILYLIKRKIKNKIFYYIAQAILLPFDLIYKFIILVFPILATQIYLFVYLGISFFIPVTLYVIDRNLITTGLRSETWIYIIATIGAINTLLFHKRITSLTFKIIPFIAQESWIMKKSELSELCKYIVSRNNIKVIIYSIFFITLFIFNIIGLQEKSYYDNSNIDIAILQSFATFVAFERIMDDVKRTRFRASELLKILKIHLFKDKEP